MAIELCPLCRQNLRTESVFAVKNRAKHISPVFPYGLCVSNAANTALSKNDMSVSLAGILGAFGDKPQKLYIFLFPSLQSIDIVL
ncbi:MAG: hypothetical protein J6J83_01410 [Oscillospiraceae bacterium]|nr:hypothetical protein [Oscillospiraceae bacterium]